MRCAANFALAAPLLAALAAPRPERPLAKFEPPEGCYIGAYVELDHNIADNYPLFERLTGRKHASYFHYLGYGQPFPRDWVERCKEVGAAPHVAWEPNDGLDKVHDDAYLRRWAREAGRADCPIFLRFASEMNGNWMPYSGDPALYVRKFRLVHDVMAQEAPNVAMVWTPFATPMSTIPAYYPGDEYVDWVGVNIYSVHHHDNDPRKPAGEDPRDLLKFVYDRYSARKPIQISEYAATHYCRACGRRLVDFAISRMSVLYASLPKQWPRVKMINWFSVDAAATGLADNDYSLTSEPRILETYRRIIARPRFLSDVYVPPIAIATAPGGPRTTQPEAPPPEAAPSEGFRLPPQPERGVSILLMGARGDTLTGTVVIIADVGSREEAGSVGFYVDGRFRALTNTKPYRYEWDTRRVADGAHSLKIVLFDKRQTEAAQDEMLVAVENR
jgi:hypothetical protein